MQKAIVIGSSFAGLWTARVLSDHFDEVVVYDRDKMPEGPDSRSGVPQDKHIHVLLKRGFDIMCDLFPGILDEFAAAGATHFDLIRDLRFNLDGVWLDTFESGLETLIASRILIESIIRRRVFSLPNVTLCDGARVLGLLGEEGAITGIKIQAKGSGSAVEASADFVVDASGRGSKTGKWLDDLGYGQVEQLVIDAGVGYAGWRFKIPEDRTYDWKAMMVTPIYPDRTQAGLIRAEEDGVWVVMLVGMMKNYPPTDPAGFYEFARTVHPEFYAAIKDAEPTVDKIIAYRNTENRRRLYEKMERWPDRFVVIGDAVCGFNPIYGQGMSISAMAAVDLGERLAKSNQNLSGLAQQYQQSYPKILDTAWLLATGSDLEWVGNDNAQSVPERIAGWYFPKVVSAMAHDRYVRIVFTQVQNLISPITAFFQPKMVWRVLRHAWTR